MVRNIAIIEMRENVPYAIRFRPPDMFDGVDEMGALTLSAGGKEIIGTFDQDGNKQKLGIFDDFSGSATAPRWKFLEMKEGYIIVGLNRKILHGREEFSGARGRRISRLWVWDDERGKVIYLNDDYGRS